MRTLAAIFLATVVLAGCKIPSSHSLPQPNLPQPVPPQAGLPQPTPSDALPSVLPTRESSPHGCHVSQEHPMAGNVGQFLLPVHQQLTGWAGLNSLNLGVSDHPITVYGQEEGPCINLGSDGRQHVGLTPDSNPSEVALQQSGSNYIYQYAHELAHVLSNWEEARQSRFKWFEETLSELASLHMLRANGRHGYADQQITGHVAERVKISDFDASGRVSEWYPQAIVRMEQNSTIRELNSAIACELLPYFESDPSLWESMAHINKWNDRSDDFRVYLVNWKQRLLSKGVHSGAPDIVTAVLYGEGNISEPLPVCSLIGELALEEGGAVGNPEDALRESMEDYDHEIAQERIAMSSSGQGIAPGSAIPAVEAMVTIPNVPASMGTPGAKDPKPNDGTPEKSEPKFEIPEDIAEATDGEDPVARQIREAAEQEENPRLREALWEEYRKHMNLD